MKFGVLRSIAHNIADSLGTGLGFPFGIYGSAVFREAGTSPEGFITIDFLTGVTSGATPSAELAGAVALYCDWLPTLCASQGMTASAFSELKARFSDNPRRVVVTVADHRGHRAVDEYVGLSSMRARRLSPADRP